MFKFYGNENMASIIVKKLGEFCYDVLTSYEAGNANQGIPDIEVLNYATAENPIVITFYRDDFVALHKSGINHAGIVVCKDDRDYVNQVRVLHAYLLEQESLENRLIRIQKQNKPKSSSPVLIVREYQR